MCIRDSIKIEKLSVKVDSDNNSVEGEDYANKMDNLPTLKVGDEVEALLLLDGNGAELKTFKLQNDEELATKLIYKEEEVSTEGLSLIHILPILGLIGYFADLQWLFLTGSIGSLFFTLVALFTKQLTLTSIKWLIICLLYTSHLLSIY